MLKHFAELIEKVVHCIALFEPLANQRRHNLSSGLRITEVLIVTKYA